MAEIEDGSKGVVPQNMQMKRPTVLKGLAEADQPRETNRCPYSDDLTTSWLGWVQTPQYFEHCYELKVLGDPCGHRNAVFFDAVQCGLDGYGSAFFAGTNAIFRRAALDSIGGIRYGTLTEDAFTGRCLNQKGWDSGYFRKDWEGEIGDPNERFPLASGTVPDSVSATFKQRKRWAQGSCEIQFMPKEKPDMCMDLDWWKQYQIDHPIQCPPSGKNRPLKQRFMRFCFFFNAMYYPWHSFAAIIYYMVNCYMMVYGTLPFYLNSRVVFCAMVPWILLRGYLNRLASVSVKNLDSQRGQETWFSFSPVFLLALWDAFYSRITGKQATWANTGGLKGGGSILELPNAIIIVILFACWAFAIYRFYDPEFSDFETPWQWFPGLFFGAFLIAQLWPMVKMSTQEYFGWSYDTLTDFSGYLSVMCWYAFLVFFCAQWKYTYQTTYSCSPYWADACYNTSQYDIYRVRPTFFEGVTDGYERGKSNVESWTDLREYVPVSESIEDDETFEIQKCAAGKLWSLKFQERSEGGTCHTGNTSMPTPYPIPLPTVAPSPEPTKMPEPMPTVMPTGGRPTDPPQSSG
mmetsp:Transcript_3694/g.7715  ORF Transcript_3694/g.7715 Transcript_3694/m.7715 type:complete len:575 (-) Transcript_3694:241-1965(-)